MESASKLRAIQLCFILAVCVQACADKSPLPSDPARVDAISLNQNWSPQLRQQMYHLSFGSRLLPIDWAQHLELAATVEHFFSRQNLQELGFIALPEANHNTPQTTAIGFAADTRSGSTWLGLTCTACHTGLVHYRGQRIVVEGAPAMLDFQAFEARLLAALEATAQQTDKFARFAAKLGGENENDLRAALAERIAFLRRRIAINMAETPYGYGRLDAFGQIFNAISVEALDLPENAHPADAPVSIPVLWDASHLDVVQWNASAPNKEPGPLGQNVTTALAVYGTVDVYGDAWLGYKSSVQFLNLGRLQSNYYQLDAPRWPEDLFGEIDQSLAASGGKIYQQNCQRCHGLVDASDPRRKLRATVVPVEQIGTDPVMARNFYQAKSATGSLQGKKLLAGLVGEKMAETVSTFDLITHVASGAMANRPWSSLKAVVKENEEQYAFSPDRQAQNYKARPLNGLWASAPYLHNGSVPTVADLLKPASERPIQFYVGALDFDPVFFGLKQAQGAQRVSLFDTRLYGNSNAGHEMGVDLPQADKRALLEYLKTL